jgi:iron(III) transport system ATP-binding protein
LEGEGWRLWGVARGDLKPGDAACGIIRIERTRIADGAAADRVRTELVTDMFLGDRRENLFKLGALRLRCYGTPPAGAGECFLELAADDLWIFEGSESPG